MTGVLVGLLCAATWASTSVMLKSLAKKLDPFTLNAPRSLIGGLSLLLLGLVTDRLGGYRFVTPESLFFMLASIGVGGGIGDSFFVYSLSRVGVSRAFPVASTYPAFTLTLGFLFLHEEITLAIVAGLILVVGGIMLIGTHSVGSGEAMSRSGDAWGVTSAVVTAVCWGVSMVLLAPAVEGLDSIMVAAIRAPALSLVLCCIVALRGTFRQLLQLSRKEWGIMVAGGVVGWGLGSLLFVQSIAMLGPTRAAIITASSPLFALPLSAVFLGEKLNAAVLIGTAVTIAGVILVL